VTPLEYRVDTALTQALRCVEHRVPSNTQLMHPGFVLALGLRYGLVEAAASHNLLENAQDSEHSAIRTATKEWNHSVAEHVRVHLAKKAPAFRLPLDEKYVGRLSESVLREYFSIYHRHCSLATSLEHLSRGFASKHHAEIGSGWPWYRFRRARTAFAGTTVESIRFASLFFDRRKADLEEVAEIALLGE